MGERITSELRAQLMAEQNQTRDKNSETILADLRGIGQEKPMGYQSYSNLDQCGVTPQQMIDEITTKGLRYYIKQQNPYNYTNDPLLYVWDEKALKCLLMNNAKILRDVGWSMDTQAFVQKISEGHVERYTPLFDLIADAFADYRNPGRLCLGPGAVGTEAVAER